MWDKIKKFFAQIDVMYHIEVTSLIVLFTTGILSLFMNRWAAFGIANAVAILAAFLKEGFDLITDGHTASVKDLIADAFGIVTTDIGLLCVLI